MKLTGPACSEAMSEAEEAERRERAEDSAGGVRVERKVGWEMSLAVWGHGHYQLQFALVLAFEKVVEFFF